jgi:hypothetical protein
MTAEQRFAIGWLHPCGEGPPALPRQLVIFHCFVRPVFPADRSD